MAPSRPFPSAAVSEKPDTRSTRTLFSTRDQDSKGVSLLKEQEAGSSEPKRARVSSRKVCQSSGKLLQPGVAAAVLAPRTPEPGTPDVRGQPLGRQLLKDGGEAQAGAQGVFACCCFRCRRRSSSSRAPPLSACEHDGSSSGHEDGQSCLATFDTATAAIRAMARCGSESSQEQQQRAQPRAVPVGEQEGSRRRGRRPRTAAAPCRPRSRHLFPTTFLSCTAARNLVPLCLLRALAGDEGQQRVAVGRGAGGCGGREPALGRGAVGGGGGRERGRGGAGADRATKTFFSCLLSFAVSPRSVFFES